MWRSSDGRARFDAACGLSRGARAVQEDAVAVDVAHGSETGFAVLSDGMGGHVAGATASHLVVAEAFGDLKFHAPGIAARPAIAPACLGRAADAANDALARQVSTDAAMRGMGATLLAVVLAGDRLHWLSVGDSTLHLLRGGALRRLNADHSMAPRIDRMAEAGQITREAAARHPDRSALTSVVMGRPIPARDAPTEGMALRDGDVVLLASDGLANLGEACVARLLHRGRRGRAGSMVDALLDATARLGDPDQDNLSVVVIRVLRAAPVPEGGA
ncbi:PP2C family protein-serine/threonine phosphatase [Jannaschia sp. LMIT008]|uniref:PP2C family protein-serine/threonine phosphatase n=1 Tax=Jannaschia maritima TaxID=3032585 RepID=UPI002811F6C4|nr:protein phosphatase 2C domain-containing protein [Jannaschia sp. LMIT008]